MARAKKILPDVSPAGVQVYAPPTESVGRPAAVAPKTALQALKPSQRVVVSAFLDPSKPTYLNAKQSYRAAHPNTTDGSAEVGGFRTLSTPKVKAVLIEELSVRGLGREEILNELAWNIHTAKASGKLSDHREGLLASAKVQGLLVDKQEVKSVSDKELDVMRRIVSETLTQGGGAS